MADHIVIVGGGFAGFWAAAAARRAGGDDLALTLLSPNPHLALRPRLYEAQPEALAVDLRPLLAELDVSYLAETAEGIEPDRHAVVLGSGATLAYSRLVVATGSVMSRPSVPGAADAFSVDTHADAMAFDARLAEIAAARRGEAGPVTIVVVGAGFTGIEVALELRDRLGVHGGAALGDAARLVLVDRAPVVGPELGPGPRPVIEAALADASVEVRLGADLTKLSANSIGFADGTGLTADAVVLATGGIASPFAAQLPGDHDDLGRVIVDRFLRAPDAPAVFVTGDAAAADTGDGHVALQSCQHALQLGRVAGENAARDLRGEPLVPYEQLRYVTCLDLGRAGAVLTQGWDRQVVSSGADAKKTKIYINQTLVYPPTHRDEILRQSEVDPTART